MNLFDIKIIYNENINISLKYMKIYMQKFFVCYVFKT